MPKAKPTSSTLMDLEWARVYADRIKDELKLIAKTLSDLNAHAMHPHLANSSGGAQGADEGGQSAGRLDEKNREPVRIQLDEHDQEGAGAEVSGFRRAQTDAAEAGGKEGVEEEIARSVIVARLTVLCQHGGARFRTALLRRRRRR